LTNVLTVLQKPDFSICGDDNKGDFRRISKPSGLWSSLNRSKRMVGLELHYPLSGLIFLAGAIVFLKGFDFLAAQSVNRLLETAAGHQAE
jgi:hypothetical protein